MDIGAIISIADVTTRVCLRLAQFIDDCRSAGETRETLRAKVTTLRGLLEAIKTATSGRALQLPTKPVSDNENEILTVLAKALDRCESTVEKLDGKLERLGNGGTKLSIRERVKLQATLDYQESDIQRIEKEIQADIAAIQVLFQCLSL